MKKAQKWTFSLWLFGSCAGVCMYIVLGHFLYVWLIETVGQHFAWRWTADIFGENARFLYYKKME